ARCSGRHSHVAHIAGTRSPAALGKRPSIAFGQRSRVMPNESTIDALELAAYVDEQLDVSRRIEIEHWLSQHPADAARVMTDLRMRDELRLAVAGQGSPSTMDVSHLGRKLQRSLDRRSFM